MLISFLVFLFGLFLVLGAYLMATRGTDAKRKRLQRRVTEALIHSAQTEDVEVILARNELMSEIPFVNRMLVQLQAATALETDAGSGGCSNYSVAAGNVFGNGRHVGFIGSVSSYHFNTDCCGRRIGSRNDSLRPRVVETPAAL